MPDSDPHHLNGLMRTIRGRRVVLDADAARLYGVRTRYLKAQATRNRDRFPPEFGFRLTELEAAVLTPSTPMPHGRSTPWVFTVEGVAMLSTVLRSPVAARLNVEIIRTTVNPRI